MARKRGAEQIDLTDDTLNTQLSSQPFSNAPSSQEYTVSQPTSSQARPQKQARTSSAFVGSSPANPYTIVDDDEEDGSQEVPCGTQGYNEAEYTWGYYGVLPTKIVGVRFYSGYATEGELVILRREPHNQYDCKLRALMVYNSMELTSS
jgi:SWI/SNF-related matrix-associated actin-dependent regulator of chromatin subfamily A3